MRCEVCGRKIYGDSLRAIIEGAKLTVCGRCAKHGKIVREDKSRNLVSPSKIFAPVRAKPKSNHEQPSLTNLLELDTDFNVKLRRAREKMGLSHEELGKKIGERVSVLKKLETGKMTPSDELVAKLEHALRLRLLVKPQEEEASDVKIPKTSSRRRDVTLGDLIQIEKREAEENEKREQS